MGKPILLRPAKLSDADLLLAWRNDPLTRVNSHNSVLITREAHIAWLEASLQLPTRRIWIAEQHGTPVGSIRADKTDEHWLLSWAVAPEHRGHGVGCGMLIAALGRIDGPVRAEIKADNSASRRIASAAGLRHTGTMAEVEVWTR